MLQPGLHPPWSSFQRSSSLSIISSSSFLGDSRHSGTPSLGTLCVPCYFSSLKLQMQSSLEVLPTRPPLPRCIEPPETGFAHWLPILEGLFLPALNTFLCWYITWPAHATEFFHLFPTTHISAFFFLLPLSTHLRNTVLNGFVPMVRTMQTPAEDFHHLLAQTSPAQFSSISWDIWVSAWLNSSPFPLHLLHTRSLHPHPLTAYRILVLLYNYYLHPHSCPTQKPGSS